MSQGDAELVGLLGGTLGAGLTAGALENYDRNNNISGYHKPNYTYNIPTEKIDQALLDKLKASGEKYNPDDIVFIAEMPDGKLVWLEAGNMADTKGSGLLHILDHADDFSKRGISNIPDFLYEILKTEPLKVSSNGKGFSAIYSVDGNLYTVAYGTNGYIVSFYPSDH